MDENDEFCYQQLSINSYIYPITVDITININLIEDSVNICKTRQSEYIK